MPTPIPTPNLRRHGRPVAWLKTLRYKYDAAVLQASAAMPAWLKTLWNKYRVRRRKIAVEREIKEAKKLSELYGCKYIVINWQGKPKAVPKHLIKHRIKTRSFVKGTTIQHFEKNAMYITH